MAALVFVSLAGAPAAAQGVSLHCRGPFELTRDPAWTFTFRPGPRAAGAGGENLQPGMCAFPDRGMRPGEPTTVLIGGGVEHVLPSGEDLTLEFVVQRLKLIAWEMQNTADYVSFLSRRDYVTVLQVSRTGSPERWQTGWPNMNPLRHVIPYRAPESAPIQRPLPPGDRPTP